MAFLGAIDSESLPLLCRLGHNTASTCAGGRTTLTRYEWWPTQRRPRLLVATGAAGTPLAKVQTTLNAELAKYALPCETRPFRPHLTLARLQRSARLLDELPAFLEDVPVERLALYRSEPGDSGSIYRIIWQAPLQSAGS